MQNLYTLDPLVLFTEVFCCVVIVIGIGYGALKGLAVYTDANDTPMKKAPFCSMSALAGCCIFVTSMIIGHSIGTAVWEGITSDIITAAAMFLAMWIAAGVTYVACIIVSMPLRCYRFAVWCYDSACLLHRRWRGRMIPIK